MPTRVPLQKAGRKIIYALIFAPIIPHPTIIFKDTGLVNNCLYILVTNVVTMFTSVFTGLVIGPSSVTTHTHKSWVIAPLK